MLDVVIGIFIFVGVIAVTTLLFSGWALYGVIRVIASGFSALIGSSPRRAPRPMMMGPVPGQVRCPRDRCHAHNPPGAAFCRRCGSKLLGSAVALSMPPQRLGQKFATPAPARSAKRVAL